MNRNEIFGQEGINTLQAVAKADRFNKWLYEIISPYLSGHILEIGSGIGNISKYFIQSGAIISLSDINPTYLQLLKQENEQYKNVRSIHHLDLLHPHFRDEYNHLKKSFDSLFILNVLEHLKDDKKALDNCSFLLKPGGSMVILVPAYSFLYSTLDYTLGHYKRYTKRRLSDLLESRYWVVKKAFYFNALGIVGWLYGKILRLKKLPNTEMRLYNKLIPISKFLDASLANQVGVSVIAVAINPDQN